MLKESVPGEEAHGCAVNAPASQSWEWPGLTKTPCISLPTVLLSSPFSTALNRALNLLEVPDWFWAPTPSTLRSSTVENFPPTISKSSRGFLPHTQTQIWLGVLLLKKAPGWFHVLLIHVRLSLHIKCKLIKLWRKSVLMHHDPGPTLILLDKTGDTKTRPFLIQPPSLPEHLHQPHTRSHTHDCTVLFQPSW